MFYGLWSLWPKKKFMPFSLRFIHLTNAFKWIPSDKNHHDSLGSCHKVFFFLSFLLPQKLFSLFFFTLPHFQFTQTAQEIYQLIIYSSVQAIIANNLTNLSSSFLHCITTTTTRSVFSVVVSPVTRNINSMNIHTTASWHRPPSTTTKYNKKNIFSIHKTRHKKQQQKELNLKHWKKVSVFFFVAVVRIFASAFFAFFLLQWK